MSNPELKAGQLWQFGNVVVLILEAYYAEGYRRVRVTITQGDRLAMAPRPAIGTEGWTYLGVADIVHEAEPIVKQERKK